MNDQLLMFGQKTYEGTPNVISLPEEDSGVSHCDKQGGMIQDQYGQDHAHALPFPQQEKAKGLQMLVTSGLIGRDSLASVSLQSSLENKLMQRLDTAGSILFKLTWKHKTTPLGRVYLERVASALRISDKGYILLENVSSPTVAERVRSPEIIAKLAKKRLETCGQKTVPLYLCEQANLASVPTPNTMDTLPPMDYEKRLNHSSRSGRTQSGNLREVVTLNLSSVASPSAQGSAGEISEELDRIGEKWINRKTGRVLQTNLATDVKMLSLSHVHTPNCPRAHAAESDAGKQYSTQKQKELQWDASQFDPGVDSDGSIRSHLDQFPRQEQLAATGETATGGSGKTGNIGQLNPEYPLWLMGIPIEWVSFVSLATQSLSLRRRNGSKRTKKREDDNAA